MEYKVGDRVRIKTMQQLMREHPYEINRWGQTIVSCNATFHSPMDEELEKQPNKRVITIKKVYKKNEKVAYTVEENMWEWSNDMIEGLELDLKESDIPTEQNNKLFSRFELLDFGDKSGNN